MAEACRGGVERIAAVLGAMPGGVEAFLDSGPVRHPRFALLAADIRRLMRAASRLEAGGLGPAQLKGVFDRLRAHFFTKAGTPRKRVPARIPGGRRTRPRPRARPTGRW